MHKYETKEQLQENQYYFPYHHLTYEDKGGVYIFRHLFWGLIHYSYINFIIEKVLNYNPKSIADIGCGEGRILCDIERKNSEVELYGYDVSDRAISFAKAFSSRTTFEVADILKKPLLNKVDVAISCEVIEHIHPTKVPIFIDNLLESVHTGGKVIITTPTTNIPVISKHYQHFSSELFDELLRDKCSGVEYEYLNKNGWYYKLLNRLLANRIFISNIAALNRFVLREYRKKLLIANKNNARRIVVTVTK